jgi:hypothetical protein
MANPYSQHMRLKRSVRSPYRSARRRHRNAEQVEAAAVSRASRPDAVAFLKETYGSMFARLHKGQGGTR